MPRSIGCAVCLLLALSVSSASLVRKKQRRERPSVVIHSLHEISLADRWHELQQSSSHHDNGFLLYLQHHERHKAQALAKAKATVRRSDILFLWRSVIWSMLVLAGAHYVVGNHSDLLISLWRDLKHTTGAAIAVNLVGTLYRQMTSGTWSSASSLATAGTSKHNPWWVVLVSMIHPNTFTYVWQTILPTTAKTIRKMLVSELWNRLFARFFAIVGTVVLTLLQDTKEHVDDNASTASLSLITWMEQDRSFVAMALKRGTRRLFQSVLQRHLHQAVVSLWNVAVTAIQAAVQPMWVTTS